jgi:hypothetical protein
MSLNRRTPTRTTLPLISAQRDTELDLIEFLRPYKRLSADKVCTQPIDASQVSIWTFKGSVWTHGVPDRAVRNGSWCQSYLTSALNLSRVEYDRAKKELFSQTNGLNGVYKHKSQDLYAIVYRPKIWLTGTNIAAIAGGTALVGLGVAGTRYALRKPQVTSQATSKIPPGPKPKALTSDLKTRIEAYDQQLGEILSKTNSRLFDSDFPELDLYKNLLNDYDTEGHSVDDYRKKVTMFESLVALDVSQNLLHSVFEGGLEQIIKDEVFTVDNLHHIQHYFEAKGDDDRLIAYKAAEIYARMHHDIKSNNTQQFSRDLDEMFELAQTCIMNCSALDLYGLVEPLRNSNVGGSVNEFLKTNKIRDEDTQELSRIISRLEYLLKDDARVPDLTEKELSSISSELMPISNRESFLQVLRDLTNDRTAGNQQVDKARRLHSRVLALHSLRGSFNDAIGSITRLNANFDIKAGLDKNNERVQHILEFARTFPRNNIPENVSQLLTDNDNHIAYESAIEQLPALDLTQGAFGNDYAGLQVINQLKKDLDNDELATGQHTKAEIDGYLLVRANEKLQENSKWNPNTSTYEKFGA